MLSIEEINKKLADAYQFAENNQVEEFVSISNDINDYLFHCIQMLTRSIPTIEQMSNMKWAVVKASAFPTILGFSVLGFLIVGSSYIPDDSLSSVISTGLFIFLGVYIWDKIKEISSTLKSLRKIKDHERDLITALAHYISVSQVLKPFYTASTIIIEDWKNEGLYIEPKKEYTDESIEKMYNDIINNSDENKAE